MEISNVKYINKNVCNMLIELGNTQKPRRAKLMFINELARQEMETGSNVTGHNSSLWGMVAYGKKYKIPFCNFLLNTELAVEWYEEAKPEYFAENIGMLRAQRGLSVKGIIAEAKLNVDVKTYSRYEKLYLNTLPNAGTLQQLADFYGVEVADLFLPPDGVGY